jgi:hypothetical protein
MEPRLSSSVLVSALIRRAESLGGFGAVLSKGDATAGAILVILAEKGRKLRVMERVLQPSGRYAWHTMVNEAADNAGEVEKFLTRRQKIDPDVWVLELDVASAERFADEMSDFD